MKKVALLELRRNLDGVIAQVQKGQPLILTRRGKAVARLEPIPKERIDPDDPFYSVCELAEPAGSLTNRQIDEILFGQ